MNETSENYNIDPVEPLSPNPPSFISTYQEKLPQSRSYTLLDQRAKIINNPYTQTVKEFMLAMITAGYTYEDNDELTTMAIQATDRLIEKAGEKL